jgi:hypothetical protein
MGFVMLFLAKLIKTSILTAPNTPCNSLPIYDNGRARPITGLAGRRVFIKKSVIRGPREIAKKRQRRKPKTRQWPVFFVRRHFHRY